MSRHWYNNGVKQTFCENPPDETFVPGRLESTRRIQSENKKQQYANQKIIPWNKNKTQFDDERIKNNCQKANQTKVERYGSAFPNNNMNELHKQKISQALKGKESKLKGTTISEETKQKISKTRTGHYVSKETRNKISKANKGRKYSKQQLEIILSKQYITKKLNNSFNTSKPEEELYQYLLEQNKTKTILRQYKDDERYPFYCDFYIVEDDLFIELNAHWSHGGRPFDPNDEFCQKQLSEWQEKAKTSQFTANAIITWTVRDVQKLECAKAHNLNYKVIY